MNTGKKFLSDLKFFESYSKWNDKLQRKETWEESVEDVMKMHYHKFEGIAELQPYLKKAEEAYKNKEILASQRNLQYREEQILKSNTRLFNCSSTYIDRPEVFKEAMWVLLNGCGVGYSVERRFVDKIPTIKQRPDKTITHIVEDSIEGWANALDALMMSFFNGTEKIRFDGRLVRPEGAFISGGFKAPGYEPLKKSLELIESILERKLGVNTEYKLTSLDAHEIICISSDAVLSAGVRRSAIICLFDKDDDLMLKAKTGDWYIKKPWLARANNSIKLLRGSFTEEEFNGYKESIKQYGDPGIVMVDDLRFCTNPCVTSDTMITTSNGTIPVKELIGKQFTAVVDGKEYLSTTDGFFHTGKKDVYKLTTSDGYELKLTKNHKLLTDRGWVELKDILLEDKIHIHNHQNLEWGNQADFDKAWLLGNLIGDGTFNIINESAILRYWGKETYLGEYAKETLNKFFRKGKPFSANTNKEITSIESKALFEFAKQFEINPNDKTPSSLIESESSSFYKGFIGGLFDADGCVQGTLKKGVSIRLSQNNLNTLVLVQRMLLKLGIVSKIYKNRRVEGFYDLPNGKGEYSQYFCKTMHELVISKNSMKIFKDKIGFKCTHKMNTLESLLSQYTRPLYKNNYYTSIDTIEYIGKLDVYDVTINDVHKFDANGLVAHNCGEIGFIPVNPRTGNTCWSFCNLNEINGGACTTKEKFFEACENAAILGTLQASYTDMPFLGSDTKELIELESLIGVSITGIMDNPQVFINAETLQAGAKIVNETNEKIAKMIGINPAARTTTVKPSGNASVLLQTSSGIHSAHSKKYFRIVQMNKNNDVAKAIAKINPIMLENSIWNTSGTDYAIFIPIRENEEVLTKDKITDSEFLGIVNLVFENWVLPGTHTDRGYSKYITHNVSNTITVNDWDKTFHYIYTHQRSFCGLSFLADTGDKTYKQAPFTKVMEFDELIKAFGTGVLFASGLVVDALHNFDDDLWDACDAVKNRSIKFTGDRYKVILKKDIVRRIKKFAKNYFDGDIDKTIDCLKNVHVFHKYETISREMIPVNFTDLKITPTYTEVAAMGAVACSGGACEITRI